MRLNQEAKSMIMAMALVGAVILALNSVVIPAGDAMFSWIIALLAVALLFWLWMRRENESQPEVDAEAAQELAKRTVIRRADDSQAGA